MWNNYNKYSVLEIFFNDPLPEGGYQLREISRLVNLAPKSVSNYLKELIKDGFVTMEKSRVQGFPVYYGNRDNESFRLYKKLDTLSSLNNCGLVDYLYSESIPECIVLFGSAARGEDIRDSDLDLFIQADEKKVDLKKYEKQLGRKINLFWNPDFDSLSSELKNNIINGVIIKGYLKIY